jgi:diguanylate cyclase (GGDEF)-like protein
MTFNEHDARRDRHVLVYVAAVAVAAFSMTTLLVVVQHTYFFSQSNWAIFGLFAVLLLLGETQPSFSMRFGDNGEVSPGWTFAFALMLFGMPVGALIVMVIANVIVDVRLQNPVRMVVFNASQIALAMSAGALVLQLFGLSGSMTQLDRIPIEWGLGIFAAAATMLVLNGVLTAVVIGLHTGAGFTATFRTGLALSMTADGALLSLAPVFVIAVDYSFVLVPLLATTSYIVIRSARNSLQRAHDAGHDPLTGLLNRRVFDERLSSAVGATGSEHETIVLVMDFDRFKEINDSLGHAVGDALLSSFAQRLSDLLPPIASAARLGGDEFAVVIPDSQHGTSPEQAIALLHQQLTEPFDIQGFPLSVSVSIGVAMGPDDGTNAEDLLAAADLAMYRAKQSEADVVHYRSTVSPLATSPGHGATGRIDLLSELAKAIASGQLTAHYQPQIEMATGAIDTVEALVRWEHPRHGMIPPDDFIAMAEQTDLIDHVTEFMLQHSMTQILDLGHPEISLAVNISPRSLLQRTFAGAVLRCLSDTGFPADRLELEITERAIADDPERTGLTVARLRDAGVRFAIDDFGTGYSSFSSLREIRADRLKIDKRFTKQIVVSQEDRLVVRTITQLGHGLGLDVVVEGVETEEIMAALEGMDPDFAQGYAIARPVPFEQLGKMVAEWCGRTTAPTPERFWEPIGA